MGRGTTNRKRSKVSGIAKDSKESREFWKAVRKAAKEVEKLPEWKRVQVGLTQEEQEAYDEYTRDGRRFSSWG